MVRGFGGVVLFACGGSASISDGGDPTSGQGGAVTSAGGATPASCGVGQPPCPPDELCDTPDDACGGVGVCVSRPTACDGSCEGVCACDGVEYCNVCVAQAAGVDVGDARCEGRGSYAAAAWFGGLDHLIISRLDVTANQCTRIYADAPTTSLQPVAIPEPWGVSSVVQYDGVDGCLDWQSQPSAVSMEASRATGTISWVVDRGLFFPCELDVDVTGQFAGDAWVEPTVVFAATGVAVGGDGCM